MEMDPELQSLSIRLAEAMARNTAGMVADRLATIRTNRKAEDRANELEELVSRLVADKNELIQIASAYDEQLVAQRLSESDVNYIASEVLPLLDQLAEGVEGGQSAEIEKVKAVLEPLLSVETLTILQIVGYNFRRGLGEPLTELTRSLIAAKQAPKPPTSEEYAIENARRESLVMEVMLDEEAAGRLETFTGRA